MELKKSDDFKDEGQNEAEGLTFLDFNSENPDGGFHDMCNSLLNQIKQVEKMYRDQFAGLKKRQVELKNQITYDIKASAVCIIFILLLVGFVRYSETVMITGPLLVLYGFIKIFLPAIAVVVLCFFLPIYLKRLQFNIRNYHVLNETFTDEKFISDVITFKQEERFLKDRLYDIDVARNAHKKLEVDYAGKFDEEWDERVQNDVDRLRKVSIFKEYYAKGLKKGSEIKQLLFPMFVLVVVGIIAAAILFAKSV